MRLILHDVDTEIREKFYPLALSRPVWELRCGMSSLGEKIAAAVGADDVACFVPDYLAASYAAKTDRPVNDPTTLAGDDLLLVAGHVKAGDLTAPGKGPAKVCTDADGKLLWAWIPRDEADKLPRGSFAEFIEAAVANLPAETCNLGTWNYTWELVLHNPEQIAEDFRAAGRSGIEGDVEEPSAVRGAAKDVYVAPGASIHPMVVLDAAEGPIYIDADVEVHPFTRIEGPCYVGPGSVLLGAKCREGNSIGPVCRIGGEVEESIVHGYSNKYHDGFLGHAYVGEWVNLGALTTNSDLKNDYSSVSVTLDGRTPVDTGSTKVGSLIGDHTKTSIGTLLNTGSYVGAMCLIMAAGKPLSKFIPSFAWMLDGIVTKGFGKKKLYETAEVAMSRRKKQWTDVEREMWDAVFEMTAGPRDELIKRGRRQMLK